MFLTIPYDRRDGAYTKQEKPNVRRNTGMQVGLDFYDVLYYRIFATVCAITTNLAGCEEPLLVSFPNQFYEAWLHFLSAFVLALDISPKCKDTRLSWRLPVEQLRLAASKLEAGEENLVNKLRTTEVEEFEIAIPLTIVVILGSMYWAGALDSWQGWSLKISSTGYQASEAEAPSRMAAMRRAYRDDQEVEKPRRRAAYPVRDKARRYV